VLLPEQIQDLKESYNKLIARAKKAEAYLSNDDTPLEERERYVGAYSVLIKTINTAIDSFIKYKIPMNDKEALDGFTEMPL
jgi:hypothetical protein